MISSWPGPHSPFEFSTGNAGALQALADGPQHLFLLGGLEDVIVLDVGAGGLEIAKAFGFGRFVGLVEQIEFELGSEIGRHAKRVEPRDLLAQHRARGMRECLMAVMIEDVAENERRCRQPRNAPERRQVGLHDEIAVALFPIGDGVARHRLHIDVVGEQIVAAVGLFIGAVDEKFGLEALADEPSLHVGEADHDRVDLAGANRFLQLIQSEISAHVRVLRTLR